MNSSTRYLPLIGYLVGGVGGGIYWLIACYFSTDIATVGALVSMVLLTGGLHEDGFADFCDGFGGGFTRENILSIMKDSRVGVYGVLGICLLSLLKYVLLKDIPVHHIVWYLIIAHVGSRYFTVLLIYTSRYTGVETSSKSGWVGGEMKISTFLIATLSVLPTLFFGETVSTFAVLIPSQLFLVWFFRYYIHKKIGGYTGDVLGAFQQLSEITIYLTLLTSFV